MDESESQLEEDEAARRAAEIATELSETDADQDRRRVVKALGAVTRSAARAAQRGASMAQRGTGAARRGSSIAQRDTGTAQQGTGIAQRDTGTAQRGTSIAEQGTGIAQRGTSIAEQGTGIAQRGTSIAQRGSDIARRGTGIALRGAGAAVHTFGAMMTWLTGQVIDMGPRLKFRDQRELRARFPDKTDDEIAELLIAHAARAAAAVGGATGVWAALPTLPAFPAEIAAETLAITGIEIKLVAELHEVYGIGVTGTATERGRAYIASWAQRRGVYMVPGGLLLVAGSPLAGQVRRRLTARMRRSTFSLAPLFTGALAGAMINSRETRKLGGQIRDDLRRHILTE